MSLNDRNLKNLISQSLLIEDEDAQEAGALGFIARVLVQATMPHRKPTSSVFKRRNNNFNLVMLADQPMALFPD